MTALAMGLKEYDHTVVDGHRLSLEDAYAVDDKFLRMTRAERREYKTIHPGRIDVVGGGAVVWSRVLARVSEAAKADHGEAIDRSLPANTVCWTALCSIMVAGCWLNSVSGKCLQRAELLSKQPGGLFVAGGERLCCDGCTKCSNPRQCSGQEIANKEKLASVAKWYKQST